jgi:hypothetical protein
MATPYPEWTRQRLVNTFANPPRYENSYYGPINGILNSIFPVHQRFLVKPQAVLRPTLPVESSIYLPPDTPVHPQATRSSARVSAIAVQPQTHRHHSSVDSQISVDSTGDAALSRSAGGWEDSILIPDFVVVKATESTHADVILALVEVKLNDAGEETAINQVESYLNVIRSKHHAEEFVAFLSMGPRTVVWRTVRYGQHDLRQVRQHQNVITGSLPFCNHLLPLRQNYWN